MKRQCLYNLSVIRGDGHSDIASRVFRTNSTGAREYPFSCIIAWCGTDGSLLKLFVLAPGEAFEDQARDLEPFLRFAKKVRMEYGVSSSDARPTFHATDTYNKRRFLWPALYNKIRLDQQVIAIGRTNKGDVDKVRRSEAIEDRTVVTGEPMHELINLRRVLPSGGKDFADIYFDHADCINRLSAPLPNFVAKVGLDAHAALADQARELLQSGVSLNASAWKERLQGDADSRTLLQTFLTAPNVLQHPAWEQLFSAMPPRGTVARLARRMGVEMRDNAGFFNYLRKQDFRAEIKRIRKWYALGRKAVASSRSRQRRILRSHQARKRSGVPRSVLIGKVRLRYKRLLRQTRLTDRTVDVAAGSFGHDCSWPAHAFWNGACGAPMVYSA